MDETRPCNGLPLAYRLSIIFAAIPKGNIQRVGTRVALSASERIDTKYLLAQRGIKNAVLLRAHVQRSSLLHSSFSLPEWTVNLSLLVINLPLDLDKIRKCSIGENICVLQNSLCILSKNFQCYITVFLEVDIFFDEINSS